MGIPRRSHRQLETGGGGGGVGVIKGRACCTLQSLPLLPAYVGVGRKGQSLSHAIVPPPSFPLISGAFLVPQGSHRARNCQKQAARVGVWGGS